MIFLPVTLSLAIKGNFSKQFFFLLSSLTKCVFLLRRLLTSERVLPRQAYKLQGLRNCVCAIEEKSRITRKLRSPQKDKFIWKFMRCDEFCDKNWIYWFCFCCYWAPSFCESSKYGSAWNLLSKICMMWNYSSKFFFFFVNVVYLRLS